MIRRSLIAFLVLLTCSTLASAQVVRRAPVSIILKLRQGSTISNAHLQATLRSVSSRDAMAVFPRSGKSASVQSIAGSGLERIYSLYIGDTGRVQHAVALIASEPAIEYAEPNYIYHIETTASPNDSLFGDEWFVKNIHAPEAWDITRGDSTIHIGFVDTGIDWDHVDLRHQLAINRAEDINHNGLFDPWPSNEKHKDANGVEVTGDLDGIDQDGNGFADDVIGYDFVDQEVLNVGDWTGRDPVPSDENGHGTYVAGVLAAEQNNTKGISGVAPGCRLVALRAFDATGNAEDDDVASAIVYAADNHVQILNLSFGDIVASFLQRDAIRYATSRGTLVFASSGNAGGSDPHYPSDFDEVVSVGGTTNIPSGEHLFALTTHGQGMDMVAPAQDIWTTAPGGGYRNVAGTSFSSPIAAASAALLLSRRPDLTPLQLRSILESSTHDVLATGYDLESANGRVDAYQALQYKGGAQIGFSNVHTLTEYRRGDTVSVNGSAASTLFTDYELSFARGINPNIDPNVSWTSIQQSSSQVLGDRVGVWNTAGLSPGVYTLRLAVHSSDLRSTEQRVTVLVLDTPPQFLETHVDTVYINEKRGLMIRATSNAPAQLEVRYHDADGHIASKRDDRLGLEHMILLRGDEIARGVSLQLDIVLRGDRGDSATLSAIAGIPNEAVPQTGFTEKRYALPPGYALNSVLATPSGDIVAESVFPDGLHFGPLKIFSFSDGKFKQIDSLKEVQIPRAFGNTKGSGGPELLTQAGPTATLYKQNQAHLVLGDKTFTNPADLWGSTLADLDGDGRDEIVVYKDSVEFVRDSTIIVDSAHNIKYIYFTNSRQHPMYQAFRWNGSSYALLGSMANASRADVYNAGNRYTEPNAEHADLRGSGHIDLLTMDNDADMVAFEYDPTEATHFKAILIDSNDGQSEGSLLSVGDFDGDGKPDIAYAYHSLFAEDTLSEYPPALWTVKVLRNLGNLQFEQIYTDRFAFARPLDPYRSSVRSIRSVTGGKGDDLVLSLFPNLYLLAYDSAHHTMRPRWHYPVSLSPRGALAFDFDRNGKREFGFVAGDSIRFFERDDAFADRTPSPAGLVVMPRDVERVDLNWSPVEHASRYYVLRAALGEPSYTVIDSTAAPLYIDSTVAEGDEYIYSVSAYGDFYPVSLSLAAHGIYAFVHRTPTITEVRVQGGGLYIQTSKPLREAALSGGAVVVDNDITATSVTRGTDSVIVARFASALSPGTHTVRIASLELRDIWNAPFDTARSYSFTVAADTAIGRFYILRWAFVTENERTHVHVVFNESPSDAALSPAFFTLTPYGTIDRVERDPADPNALNLSLSDNTQFAALGVPFVLCVKTIESTLHHTLEENVGNCAGVSFTEQDLSHVMTYPNPGSTSYGQVTFGRLTAQADIRIFTQSMRFLRQVSTLERQGGAVWDLRDEQGEVVPSGEYLYFVTGKNDAGESVEGHAGKLVIIRDN